MKSLLYHPPRPLCWHYPHYGNQGGAPSAAIRDGDWKLIEWYEDNSQELYNLKDDLSETHNLAAEHPDKVSALHARLDAFRADVGAIMPKPNPDFGKPEAGKKKGKGKAAE